MAEKITAQDNQTFQNLTIQATGGLGSLFQFCFDNAVSISDTPVVGHEYIVSDEALALGDAEMLAKIKAKDIKIGNLGAEMPCSLPIGVTFTSITSTQAFFSWSNPDLETFHYLANTTGIEPEFPTDGSGAHGGTAGGIGSLTPDTAYFLFINHRCGSESYSPWLKIPFRTLP